MAELLTEYMGGKVPSGAQVLFAGVLPECRERYFLGTPGCGKSTSLIAEVNRYCLTYPGSVWLLARYTETEAASVLKGDFEKETPREILTRWDHEERRYYYRNSSSVYIHGLKPAEGQAPFCVAPETKILTADLRWVEADSLRVGDRLIGVEENPSGRSKRRRLLPSDVQQVWTFTDLQVRVTTDRGAIVVSTNHPFLVYLPNRPRRHLYWVRAAELRPGMRLTCLTTPWETPPEGDAAWFGGFLDGEGCLAFRNDRLTSFGLAQNPGLVLDHARQILDRRGFTYSTRMTGPRKSVCDMRVSGVGETLRALGSFRPIRLRARFDRGLEAGQVNLPANKHATITRIDPVGEGVLVGIETSTQTYIANGFASHNSKFAGYNLSGVGISQAEALPGYEWVERLEERLRHPNPPRLFLAEGNVDVTRDHWLFKLVDSAKVIEEKRLYQSGPRMVLIGRLEDNARNLPVEFVEGLRKSYPPGHPQHGPKVGGWFGPGESGDPVYGSTLFRQEVHLRTVEYDPKFPLLEAWDFGIARPAVLWSQFLPGPRWVALGEWMGNDTPLGDAARESKRLVAQWFPQAKKIYRTADPAGMARKDVGPSSVRFLQNLGLGVTVRKGANTPAQRMWAIQQVRDMLQRRVGASEAVQVHPRCEILTEGMRFGYKRDPHRADGMPIKDGWFDHIANCLEYTFIAFYGSGELPISSDGSTSVKAWLGDLRDPGEPKTERQTIREGY